MGQRGAGWTDTSQEAMDSAAREHQERMAAKTAYLKVQIPDESYTHNVVCVKWLLFRVPVLGSRHWDRIKRQPQTSWWARWWHGRKQVLFLLLWQEGTTIMWNQTTTFFQRSDGWKFITGNSTTWLRPEQQTGAWLKLTLSSTQILALAWTFFSRLCVMWWEEWWQPSYWSTTLSLAPDISFCDMEIICC